MALWGANTTNQAKPKYLSDLDKTRTYATSEGWVFNRPDGTQEILVAIGGLNTSLGNSAISAVYFANSTYTQGLTNAHVAVAYTEKVTVDGVPTLNVLGGTTNAVASYVSGNNTNVLLFKFTVPSETQTLSLRGQTITTNSTVTIVETSNASVNAAVTFANTAVVGVLAVNGANSQIAVA